MLIRLPFLFIVLYLPLAALDAVTTRIGLRVGYHEWNPLAAVSSVKTMMIRECIIFLIGLITVILGTWIGHARMETLLASKPDFAVYYAAFFKTSNAFAASLILLPLAATVLRVLPVINNVMYLTVGWGPFGAAIHLLARVGVTNHFLSGSIICITAGVLLVRPVTYLIYRVCQSGVQG